MHDHFGRKIKNLLCISEKSLYGGYLFLVKCVLRWVHREFSSFGVVGLVLKIYMFNTSVIMWVKGMQKIRKNPGIRLRIKLWTFKIFKNANKKLILLWANSRSSIIFLKFWRARHAARRNRFRRETVVCKNKNRGSIRNGRFTHKF